MSQVPTDCATRPGVVLGEKIFEILYHNKCSPSWLCDLSWVFFFSGKIGSWNVFGENIQALWRLKAYLHVASLNHWNWFVCFAGKMPFLFVFSKVRFSLNSPNDVPQVAQRYVTIAAHTWRRVSVQLFERPCALSFILQWASSIGYSYWLSFWKKMGRFEPGPSGLWPFSSSSV